MLDLLLSMSENALLIFDETGKILRVNTAAAEMFGWSIEELQKKRISALMPQADARKHTKLFQTFLAGKESSRKMGQFRSILARRKSGEEFPIEAAIGKGDLDGKLVAVASLRDIGEEKRAEELTRSLALLPYENPNPVFRVSSQGKIIFSNASAQTMLKMIAAQDLTHVPTTWMEYVRQSLADGSQVVQIISHEHHTFSHIFTPVLEMGYVNIYALDVTEREVEKSRLALSDNILNSVGNLVLVANKDAEIIYISPSSKDILGYASQELLHSGWWEVERVSGGNVAEEMAYIRKAASGEIKVDGKPYKHRIRHKDGSWRWLMLADTKGPGDLLIGIGTDITSIKRVEDALTRQNDFSSMLMENMGQGLTFTDKDGHFTYVNKAYARILGYDPEELLGKSPFDITFPEDYAILENAKFVHANGQVNSYETRLLGKDGREIYAFVTGVPRFEDGAFAGAVTVITDLTERRQMEKQLRAYADAIEKSNVDLAKARDRALEASYLKSAFLATMSHEIRTPMNAIMGMSELLLGTPLNEEQHEFASVIEASTQNLLSILNDILDFSKIEAEKLSIRTALFHPRDLIQETVKLFSSKAQKKNIHISAIITDNIPETLAGDAGRIQQILNNLVSNALKFTNNNGFVLINLSGTQINKDIIMITITVQDSGEGISDELKPMLFEPFTQADTSHSRKHGGTGLGLAISKRLVNLMNGEISYVTVPGTGTSFWFSLPLSLRVNKQMEIPPDTSISLEQSLPLASKKLILIAEDNIVNRDLFTLQLKEFGLYARHATNGQEAVELLKVLPDEFSLVLMDLNMPVMDGFTAAKHIRENEAGTHRHIPIIAVTANAIAGTQDLCIQAGIDGYLSKPFSLKNLKETLERWLLPVSI